MDALVLEPGRPPRTASLARSAGVADDVERLAALLGLEGSVDWRVVGIASELPEVRAELERRYPRPGTVTATTLERSVHRLGRRPRAPFAHHARRAFFPRSVRIPIALLALAAMAYAALVRSVDRDAAYASLLSRTVLEEQARAGEAAALQREVDGLRAGLAALRADRPPDPGQVLADLAAVLGPETRLESFSLEGGIFQLEAVGSDPLRLMERFASNGAFADVRLLQIVPRNDGVRELFRVTGRAR